MTRQEIHKILDVCLDEVEEKAFYGQMSFILHCQKGTVQQITDEGWKRTWRNMPPITP